MNFLLGEEGWSYNKSRVGAGVKHTVASGDLSKKVFHRLEQVGKISEFKGYFNLTILPGDIVNFMPMLLVNFYL